MFRVDLPRRVLLAPGIGVVLGLANAGCDGTSTPAEGPHPDASAACALVNGGCSETVDGCYPIDGYRLDLAQRCSAVDPTTLGCTSNAKRNAAIGCYERRTEARVESFMTPARWELEQLGEGMMECDTPTQMIAFSAGKCR